MAREDAFVTIATLHDPVQAEMIRELLAESGIVATAVGASHRSMLGVIGGYIQVAVQVPAHQAEEAMAIVKSLEEYDAVLPEGDAMDYEAGEEGPYRSSPSRRGPTGERPRLKAAVVVLSLFVTFGTGHFHARELVSGALLAGGELLALLATVSGYPGIGLAVPALVLVDLFGALRAVDRYNSGQPRTARRQLASTGTIVTGLLALALLASLTSGA